MRDKGFAKFGIHHHTNIWQEMDAKNPEKNFGVQVEGQWYWYENWLQEVEGYLNENRPLYIMVLSHQISWCEFLFQVSNITKH